MGGSFIRIPQEPFESSWMSSSDDTSTKNTNNTRSFTASSTTPDSSDGSSTSSDIRPLSWPIALDFKELHSMSRDDFESTYNDHMLAVTRAGLQITDEQACPMQHVLTKQLKSGITVKAEKAAVDGTYIECVRHTADLPYEADFVLDLYQRLTYTRAIDAFTYEVNKLEEIQVKDEQFVWAHVAYTADRLTRPLLAHRDFVTFDWLDRENMIIVSRSCFHPTKPVTKPPRASDCIKGLFSNNVSRTFRSPLCYFLRIISTGPKRCKIVQFQHSDVGGVVPPKEQTKAVLQFGIDNLGRISDLLGKAKERGLNLGVTSEDYLKDPLRNGWKQAVDDMVPGL